MMRKKLILIVIGATAVTAAAMLHPRSNGETGVLRIAQSTQKPSIVQPNVAESADQRKLRALMVDDYHSADSHTAITSAIAHELIAEQLRTNEAFLEWATNVVISTVTQFVQNATIPIYGSAHLTGDTLKLRKVTADAPVGLHAEAVFDPNPSVEGPLIFIVEGGTHPTIQLVRNPYRTEMHQLNPIVSRWSPREIGPMDWSCAVAPLDKRQVDETARKAFHAMTGVNLDSFDVQTKIETEGLPNRTGSNGMIFSAKDVVYPFATFKYGDSNSVRVPFSGQMVQTSPGHGEFVSLLAIVSKADAAYELGERFLGQGTWEGSMLRRVNSMDTEQRGEVYRRLFVH